MVLRCNEQRWRECGPESDDDHGLVVVKPQPETLAGRARSTLTLTTPVTSDLLWPLATTGEPVRWSDRLLLPLQADEAETVGIQRGQVDDLYAEQAYSGYWFSPSVTLGSKHLLGRGHGGEQTSRSSRKPNHKALYGTANSIQLEVLYYRISLFSEYSIW